MGHYVSYENKSFLDVGISGGWTSSFEYSLKQDTFTDPEERLQDYFSIQLKANYRFEPLGRSSQREARSSLPVYL